MIHALLITGRLVTWMDYTLCTVISRASLLDIFCWIVSYSHKYLLWTAQLALHPRIFSFTRCVVQHLGLSEKLSRDPHVHTLCSWGSSGALLRESCICCFKSAQCIWNLQHPMYSLLLVVSCPIINSMLPCNYQGSQNLSYWMSNVSLVILQLS